MHSNFILTCTSEKISGRYHNRRVVAFVNRKWRRSSSSEYHSKSTTSLKSTSNSRAHPWWSTKAVLPMKRNLSRTIKERLRERKALNRSNNGQNDQCKWLVWRVYITRVCGQTSHVTCLKPHKCVFLCLCNVCSRHNCLQSVISTLVSGQDWGFALNFDPRVFCHWK